MTLPIGEIDPIQQQKHLSTSVSIDKFVTYSQGKTLEQLQFENGSDPSIFFQSISFPGTEVAPVTVQKGLGPKDQYRYIQDPNNPGMVIDMRHFIEAAQFPLSLGEWAGAIVEIHQGTKGYPSAWEKEDYRSNFLGVVFRNNYYDPNGNINEQFSEFFTDLQNKQLEGAMPALEYTIEWFVDKAKDAQQIFDRAVDELGGYFDPQSNFQDAIDKLKAFVDPPAYADDTNNGFGKGEQQVSPLVLDLDGDGVELTAINTPVVRFDIDGDGFREATGWVKSDDGLLVFDRNNDGFINDSSELFGNQLGNNTFSNGFESLKALDTNKDNIINISDTNFAKLQVWRDFDSDGRSDVNELFTLNELGIKSIKTSYSNVNVTNAGNTIKQTSTYELTNGTSRTIVDAWFNVDQFNSTYDYRSTVNKPITFTQEILNLPNLRGYGNLPDLQIAMAKDTQLLSLVKSFKNKSANGDIAGAGELIRPILLRWAGVDAVNPTSRGTSVNAQELGFLEKFLGRYFINSAISTPAPNQGTVITQTYRDLAPSLATRLIAQTFNLPITYDESSDTITFTGGTTAEALTKFQQIIADPTFSSSAQLNLEASVLGQYLREQEQLDASFILGSVGSDTIVGSTNSDRIFGLTGNDKIDAGAGIDTLDGGIGDDTLIGNTGNDSIIGSDGNDSLDGGSENDTLAGGNGNDILMGGYGSDNLHGGTGNDILDADGNYSYSDTLNGAEGNDTLIGGGGNDIYYFDRNLGFDTIKDIYTPNSTTISDGGTSDRIDFGTGINNNNLNWYFNSTDLIFSIIDSPSDKLVIQNMYDSKYRVEQFNVQGIILTQSDIMTKQVWNDEAGRNLLDWKTSAIKFNGGAGNDTITTGSYNDSLLGAEGNDKIDAGAGVDTLDGGIGDDTLIGNTGNDSIIGADGNDSLDGGSENDTLAGGNGNDILMGGSYSDNLHGGTGNDILDADGNHAFSDTLNGAEGNDTLIGGGGNDVYYFDRGLGFDTIKDVYSVNNTTNNDGGSSDRIDFGTGVNNNNLNWYFNGTDLTFSITDFPLDKLVIQNMYDSKYRIEQFNVQGVILTQSDIMTKQVWNDEAGRNLLDWKTSAIKFNGGAGNDTLIAGSYTDSLIGGEGDDSIDAGAGNDTLFGGNGNDLLIGGSYSDNLNGETGNDILDGGSENDTLNGAEGNDTLYGGGGNDVYYFDRGLGFDTIKDVYSVNNTTNNDGGTSDRIDFGTGINNNNLNWYFNGTDLSFSITDFPLDKLVIQNMYDSKYRIEQFNVQGVIRTQSEIMTKQVWSDESTRNTLDWKTSAIWFDGAAGNDSIITGNYADRLFGGDGDDTISSSTGDDLLDGGFGNDSIDSGYGKDTITGGAGIDIFIYKNNVTYNNISQMDTITDFTSGTDKIALGKSTFTSLTSLANTSLNANEFTTVGSDSQVATAGGLIVYSSSTGNLFYNQNGAAAGWGAGGQFATLSVNLALTANDFLIQA
jgi:Ca2+-binding RTX toxin-like protein